MLQQSAFRIQNPHYTMAAANDAPDWVCSTFPDVLADRSRYFHQVKRDLINAEAMAKLLHVVKRISLLGSLCGVIWKAFAAIIP